MLRRLFPDIEGTVEDGLMKTIPEKAGATIAPVVVVPTPEGVLRKVSDASVRVLLIKEVKELEIFLGDGLTERRRDEVTGEDRGRVNEEKKRKSESGEKISETVVEEGKEIEDEDSTNGEEDGEGKTEREREFSEGRAEEFREKRNKVEN